MANMVDRAVAWRFFVELDGVAVAEFTECSGLTVERETTPLNEGGRNDFSLQLPGRIKYTNITLKRGVVDLDLWDWFAESVDAGTVRPKLKDITITLGDTSGKAAVIWYVTGAFPVKWTGPDFNVESNQLAMESLELAHSGFTKVEKR